MNPNIRLSDRCPIATVIDPDAYSAAAYTSGWLSMADYINATAHVLVGDMASTATLDAKLQEATDSVGSGAADLTGKAITQLTQAGGDSNKRVAIDIAQHELTDGFTHVRLVVTIANAAVDMAAVFVAGDAHAEPVTQAAETAEVVS